MLVLLLLHKKAKQLNKRAENKVSFIPHNGASEHSYVTRTSSSRRVSKQMEIGILRTKNRNKIGILFKKYSENRIQKTSEYRHPDTRFLHQNTSLQLLFLLLINGGLLFQWKLPKIARFCETLSLESHVSDL